MTLTQRRNMVCLLPDHCIPVHVRLPHPCGGYYTHEVRCYGPRGFIGFWMADQAESLLQESERVMRDGLNRALQEACRQRDEAQAERDRVQAVLERIASGDVPGTGNGYLSVQRFAREALDG